MGYKAKVEFKTAVNKSMDVRNFTVNDLLEAKRKLEELEKIVFPYDLILVGSEELKLKVEDTLNKQRLYFVQVKVSPYTDGIILINQKAMQEELSKNIYKPYGYNFERGFLNE